VADLRLNIIGNAESANRAMNQVARNVANQAKGMAKAFAVNQAKDFFGGMISAARESEKVSALTAQTIKSMGDVAGISAEQVGELSAAIAMKTGVDDEAIQSGANLLLTFGNIKNAAGEGNDVFNQTTEIMTDMSVALGTDAKAGAIQLGKALNDPIKGVSALSRVGVSFTEEQKEQIKTLVKSGKTMDAQKVILGELKKQFGGAAEAAATPADKMKVAWGNLQETMGAKVIPALNKVTTAGIKVVAWLEKNEKIVKPVVIGLAALVVTVKAITLATRAWTAVQAAFNVVMALNPVFLIIAGLVALGVALVVAYKKSETFRNIVDGVFKAVRTYFQTAWTVMSTIFGYIRGAFDSVGKAAGAMKDVALKAVQFLVDKFLGAVEWIIRGAARAFGWVPVLGDKLKDAARGIERFRDEANAYLSGVRSPRVKVTVDSSALTSFTGIYNNMLNTIRNGLPVTIPPPAFIPGAANGVVDWRGGPIWVGEHGKELLNLPKGSSVTPHNESMSMVRSPSTFGSVGGGNVIVYVTGVLTERQAGQAVAGVLEQFVGSGGTVRINKGMR
jgi:hypothetical protein